MAAGESARAQDGEERAESGLAACLLSFSTWQSGGLWQGYVQAGQGNLAGRRAGKPSVKSA